MRDAGRIVGVRSASMRPPLRKVGFPPEYVAFEKARTLGDWTFTASASASSASASSFSSSSAHLASQSPMQIQPPRPNPESTQ